MELTPDPSNPIEDLMNSRELAGRSAADRAAPTARALACEVRL